MFGLTIAFLGLVLLSVAILLTRRVGLSADPQESVVSIQTETEDPGPPESWESILRRDLALYAWLPESLRGPLQERMAQFLAEKRFEACGSLERVTGEMRVLIAAQACLLLVGRPRDRVFPRLRSILVYPSAFRDRGRRVFGLEEGDDTEREIRLGESWNTGSVILSWESVKAGAAGAGDGVNVVLHEFAHQLDQADGSTDGVPLLGRAGDYDDWADVMRRHYDSLVEAANNPREDPLLDPYGAENPAEFFAVATETFFEMPEDLLAEHPDLYRELKNYFGLDPAAWICGEFD